MSSSRDTILNKLRSARRPFADAPPRPAAYLNVTTQDDETPDALLERFTRELGALTGEVFPVRGAAAARKKVLQLLAQHEAKRILAWDFAHIPLDGLEAAIREAGIEIIQPDAHDEMRMETLTASADAQVGLTGADAAAATTGTLVFTTAPGKGRIPTVLAPVHIVVITLNQIVPRIESWVAAQRAQALPLRKSANFCFITGPSRTGDIEMQMVLGVHGPGKIQVVVKR
ncbi:MAG: LUD domain-containing protein [Anaerolineae bacterium]|nr:LUD domain-containing protein [Anaerolineae bacterium]